MVQRGCVSSDMMQTIASEMVCSSSSGRQKCMFPASHVIITVASFHLSSIDKIYSEVHG